jgi:hypothetical protein
MIPWDYDGNKYSKEDVYPLAPEGEYPVKILDVKFKVSTTDKDMYVMRLGVVDKPGTLFYNLVFEPDNKDRTNQNLGRIFDSFAIPAGELDTNKWINKVGAAKIKHEPDTYRGGDKASIERFLTQERQVELGFVTPREVEEGELDLDGEEMPF